jgi:hypothetical protein
MAWGLIAHSLFSLITDSEVAEMKGEENRATLNTTTGRVTEPNRCLGHDPVLCDPSPSYNRSCVAALVAQQEVARTNRATNERIVPRTKE